ncbi:MAG: hypothetical protein GXC73_14165 [Chitinophagaceae bacterium]|nr:hypothetical protein [Chitinophagaceae bacterium]
MERRRIANKSARFGRRQYARVVVKTAVKTHARPYNFSEVEDKADAYSIVKNITVQAGFNAAAEAKALGIERVYVKDNSLIKISAQGHISPVESKTNRQAFYVKYNTSKVLHAVTR